VLAPIGLRLAEEKTRVVHIDEGFDFLSFAIRRMRKRGTSKQYVYTFPSRTAIQAIKDTISAKTYRSTRNLDPEVLIQSINRTLAGSPGAASLLRDVAWTGHVTGFCGASPRVRCSWLVVVHAAQRDRGIRDAGFPSEVAVRGEVLDGSG